MIAARIHDDPHARQTNTDLSILRDGLQAIRLTGLGVAEREMADMATTDTLNLDRPVKAPIRPGPAMEMPSLIGLSREDLGQALAGAGVPQKQVKMRVSQLWHWLYVRGVSDFDRHDQCLQGPARNAEAAFHHCPTGNRRGADLQ